MSTYLITGGAGHIGSTLADALLAAGHTVVVVDNLSTGRRENIDDRVLFIENPSGHFSDITVQVSLLGPFRGVFHLASSVGVHEVVVNPAYVAWNIVNLAYEVERWRGRYPAHERPRLVVASSSEVYGSSLVPMAETDTCQIRPGRRWAYAAAKLATESIAPDAIVARIFNTIGPRQRTEGGAVAATFMDNAIRGLPLEVNGTTTRSFSCVHDTVSGLMALMDKGDAGIYNVGASNHASIHELALRIKDITGSRSPIEEWSPVACSDDISDRRPNLDKLKSLGWSQQWDLDKTLRWIVAEKIREREVLTSSVI